MPDSDRPPAWAPSVAVAPRDPVRLRFEAPFEVRGGSARSGVFLTCEHASERLPSGYDWHAADRRLAGTHWAYDLGAAELVHDIADAVDAPAFLARFSRLLVDLNRPEDAPTLFRPDAEGAPVELNRALTDEEREHRLARYHRPYHDGLDVRLGAHDARVLFSVHTFTPVYEGAPRAMEVGVLFDREEALAEELAATLARAGFVVAMNEPYSGRAGLIYAAERHATTHDRRALEIEVRQDRAVDARFRARLVAALAPFLGAL